MKKSRIALAALLPLVALAGACATDGAPRFDEAQIAADSRFSEYQKVYIADVAISSELRNREDSFSSYPYGSRLNDERRVTEKDLNKQADDLKKRLKSEIGRTKQVVSAPGPGVLTVQAEILNVSSNKPTMADLQDEPALSMDSAFTGRTDVRVTITGDGQTLATIRDDYQGDRPGSSGMIWSDAKRGFQLTAKKVAMLIG